jgi:opacity protein-like surface antigen
MRKVFVLAALLVLVSGAAMAQDHPKAEIFGGYSFAHISPGQGIQSDNLPKGWHASVAGNFNDWFGIAGDISGNYGKPDFGTGIGLDTKIHTYTFGPRISYRKNEKVTPFAHVQFGGAHLSGTGVVSENAFAMNFGGGVDIKINNNFAIRAGQFDYVLTRFNGPVTGTKTFQHNFRYSAGIVIRLP